ncbi:MAG TPA: SAM-dependent methyltransferase [Kineosporiaceae bacterium]
MKGTEGSTPRDPADAAPVDTFPEELTRRDVEAPPGLVYSTVGIDTTQANIARVYDYWLGGKDNYEADRRVGETVRDLAPWIVRGVRANREFLVRAVTRLAEAGVDQFLDIGSGLPTMRNVHEVAQRVKPHSRVVYVDNDPMVLAHARALMGTDAGTWICRGDLREPGDLLDVPEVRDALDWGRPVAVLMIAVLHFLADQDGPADVVRTLRDEMAPGSYLVVSHTTPGNQDLHAGMPAAIREYTQKVGPFTPRTRPEVEKLLDGFVMVPPGLVDVEAWPDLTCHTAAPVPMVAGLARWDGPRVTAAGARWGSPW